MGRPAPSAPRPPLSAQQRAERAAERILEEEIALARGSEPDWDRTSWITFFLFIFLFAFVIGTCALAIRYVLEVFMSSC